VYLLFYIIRLYYNARYKKHKVTLLVWSVSKDRIQDVMVICMCDAE